MPKLSERVNKFSQSLIRDMTILANEYGAINLAQGFPEFEPPLQLKEALKKVSLAGPHQYAPSYGADNFRRLISEKQSKSFKRNVDKEQILVTCGSTEAMASIMFTITNPGDKVIIFSPSYSSYKADSILANVDPIFVQLHGDEFSIDKKELEEAFSKGVKAIIICNPCNPCGKIFTKDELLYIAELAEKYDAFVVVDEVYEHIIFEPYKHIHFASLPNMFERAITCSSLSKTYSITGWRLGFVTAPSYIIDNIRKIHDLFTVSAPSPLQEAAVTALSFKDEYYIKLQELYTSKKNYFLNGLNSIGIKHNDPQGTYFVMIDISEFNYSSDIEFCKMLVKEYKVAAVPGSAFYSNNENKWIRMHFAKNNETLDLALERLGKLKFDFKKKVIR